MHGQFLEVGLILIIVGSVLASMSAFVVGRRAFKVNLLWGVACLIIPLATLVFPFFSWREFRGLFLMQLAGMAVLIAGVAVVLLDADTRSGIQTAMGERSQLASALGDEDPDGIPTTPGVGDIAGILQGRLWSSETAAKRPTPASPKQTAPKSPAELRTAAEQKEREVQAMYLSVQASCNELQKRRPAAGAQPEEVRTFNQDYAKYQALLDRYKIAVEELKKTPAK